MQLIPLKFCFNVALISITNSVMGARQVTKGLGQLVSFSLLPLDFDNALRNALYKCNLGMTAYLFPPRLLLMYAGNIEKRKDALYLWY